MLITRWHSQKTIVMYVPELITIHTGLFTLGPSPFHTTFTFGLCYGFCTAHIINAMPESMYKRNTHTKQKHTAFSQSGCHGTLGCRLRSSGVPWHPGRERLSDETELAILSQTVNQHCGSYVRQWMHLGKWTGRAKLIPTAELSDHPLQWTIWLFEWR